MLSQSRALAGRPNPPHAIHDGPLLLPLEDVAERLSISKRTLERLVYGGQLGSVKLRGRRLVPWHELAAYVARLEAGADAMQVAPPSVRAIRAASR